jgi:hypothetical protein
MSHKVEYKTFYPNQLAEYLDKLTEEGAVDIRVQHIGEFARLFQYMLVYRMGGLGQGMI